MNSLSSHLLRDMEDVGVVPVGEAYSWACKGSLQTEEPYII